MKNQLLLSDDDIRNAIAFWIASLKRGGDLTAEAIKPKISLHIEKAVSLPGPLYAIVTLSDQ